MVVDLLEHMASEEMSQQVPNKMFFQNLKPLILEEKKKQLQKQNVKMNLTVKCEERRAENGLNLRFGQNDHCAMKTSTCHDFNITEGLLLGI